MDQRLQLGVRVPPVVGWDGTTLYFGSNRAESEAGSADIYVTTREPLKGGS